MPEKPAAERTEQPTRKKLERARKKGQVPQSQELTSMVTLLVLILILALLAPSFLKWSITVLEYFMVPSPLIETGIYNVLKLSLN